MVRSPEEIDAPAAARELDDDDRDESGDDPGPPTVAPPRLRDGWDRLERWVGLAIVATCCIYLFIELEPKLVLRNSTVTGGDTGAHVWFPDFLIDNLLPWRVAGWSNDFYAGFPAGQFYFPLPAVLIALLDVVLPYNIAFKLVTAIGPVTLPAGAYVFARGIRVPRPTAPLFALAAVVFMYFKQAGDATMTFDVRIMGGNLASTLAGEYSFTIALTLSLCFLGALARMLDRRGSLWLPAVLLALTFTSHLVVAVFAVYAGAVLWLCIRPVRNFTRIAAIGAVGVLLTAFWLLPVAVNLDHTTDMRYEPIGDYLDWMFLSENWFLYPFAAVAVGAGIWYRRRATLLLGALTVASGLAFYHWEGVRELLGKAPAWNLRLLPFWFLMLVFLAALGVAEVVRLAALGVTWLVDGPARAPVQPVAATQAPLTDRRVPRHGIRLLTMAVLTVVVATIGLARIDAESDFLPYWARYNYTGYESGSTEDATAKSWPEYEAFMDTAGTLAPGRMAWEGGDAIGAYGTPLALMLLPYWTDGRIQSMEGLYFEASTTTPYHFMMIATLAQSPSNPVRGMPYKSIADFDLGVRYLQLMGVRYYAAFSDAAKTAAAANPNLEAVATVPDLDAKAPSGWTFYRVADSPTVQALDYEPVVVEDLHQAPAWECQGLEEAPEIGPVIEYSPWECVAVPWFSDPAALDRSLTDGGPEAWLHADPDDAREQPKRALPDVDVSNIRTTESSVEFDVSRTGVPVMVKTSYYPNWTVEGAEGPWRATPNFMVVVPTSKHVKLTFETATVDQVGRVLTIVGLLGLAGLVWWSSATRRERRTGDRSRGMDRARGRVRFSSRSPR
jgi:hypothetical protein